jgi:hypothetical protein
MRSNARNTPLRDIPTRAAILLNDHPFARSEAINRSRSSADKLYNRSPTPT